MRLGKALKKLEAHVWQREANEHYVEPDWCSRRLFEEEDFWPAIWDPCAGFGRIPEEAAKQGLKAHATDIVDRGYSAFDGVQNFLTAEATRAPVIVCNPPFATASHFAVKALSLEGVEQVAMIFPTARLNAAHWLRDTSRPCVADDTSAFDAARTRNCDRREAGWRQDGLLLVGLGSRVQRRACNAMATPRRSNAGTKMKEHYPWHSTLSPRARSSRHHGATFPFRKYSRFWRLGSIATAA